MIILSLLLSTALVVNAINGCENVYPYAIDFGIYWAGFSNETGLVELEKSCASSETPYISKYFVTNKKTLIITHGDQPLILELESTRFGYQEGFDLLMRGWLLHGWNVGIFQWTQFADEPVQNFERAQAKIWTSHYFSNMEYTYIDNTTDDVNVGEYSTRKNVADLLVEEILDHNISHLRLAGHSLGAQLVTRVAHLLQTMNKTDPDGRFIVDRVALLDPVFSALPQGFLFDSVHGMYVADNIAEYIHELRSGRVACEIYQTTQLNNCVRAVNANLKMMRNAAYARVELNTWGEKADGDCYSSDIWGDPKNLPSNANQLQVQISNQHRAVVQYYLESLFHPPLRCSFAPVVDVSDTVRPCTHEDSLALGAAMPDQQVRGESGMRDPKTNGLLYFQQYDDGDRSVDGSTMTINPGDDYFFKKVVE